MGKHVLIVEDDEMIADHWAMLVRDQFDCVPLVTSRTSDAMGLADDKIEFGLLDIQVSDGLTFEVAKRLQERGVPFVFVSGSDPATVPPELSNTPFLRKPVPATRLLEIARRHL
jgi:DNA-binding NtrC family response regulator